MLLPSNVNKLIAEIKASGPSEWMPGKTHFAHNGLVHLCYETIGEAKKGNVLILDEPTNHLDLESITAFNNSLKNFKGTVLFSTHDHEFAQTIANRIIELTPSGIIDRYMTFEEYMNDSKIKQLRESMLETT